MDKLELDYRDHKNRTRDGRYTGSAEPVPHAVHIGTEGVIVAGIGGKLYRTDLRAGF